MSKENKNYRFLQPDHQKENIQPPFFKNDLHTHRTPSVFSGSNTRPGEILTPTSQIRP